MSSGNLSSNPRLVKEADALHQAGYDVTTIVCDYTEALKPFDDEIANGAPWKVIRLPRDRSERYITAAARPVAQVLAASGMPVPLPVASHAYGGPAHALRRAAAAVAADLYIAHYIPALPAAAAAARRHRALLGFDAEDLHSGEAVDDLTDSAQPKLVMRIEQAYLPACTCVTASSPMIGDAYAACYGVNPRTVLNVFSKTMAAPVEAAAGEAREPGHLAVYWFSQTIGLDRGLQEFMRAMARAKAKVSLDVRGSNRWGHGDTLMAFARDLGVAERVQLLPTAAPDQMVKLATTYDLGLSLEIGNSPNKRACLGNKIFTYLLAGVPVMVSDTPAQRAFALELGSAAAVASVSDPEDIARTLDRLAASSDTLADAKATAWRLADRRYNWEVEQKALVEEVGSAFTRHAGR